MQSIYKGPQHKPGGIIWVASPSAFQSCFSTHGSGAALGLPMDNWGNICTNLSELSWAPWCGEKKKMKLWGAVEKWQYKIQTTLQVSVAFFEEKKPASSTTQSWGEGKCSCHSRFPPSFYSSITIHTQQLLTLGEVLLHTNTRHMAQSSLVLMEGSWGCDSDVGSGSGLDRIDSARACHSLDNLLVLICWHGLREQS